MLLIKRIIIFLARIIASAFASLFVTSFFFTAWFVIPYLPLRSELFNSAMCYVFHAIPICEFNFLSLLDLLFSFPIQYEPPDFINNILEGYNYIVKHLIQSAPYVVSGFIAVLVFKFMWNDTKPKNKVSTGLR